MRAILMHIIRKYIWGAALLTLLVLALPGVAPAADKEILAVLNLKAAAAEDQAQADRLTAHIYGNLDFLDLYNLLSSEEIEKKHPGLIAGPEADLKTGLAKDGGRWLLSGEYSRTGEALTTAWVLTDLNSGQVRWQKEYTGSAQAPLDLANQAANGLLAELTGQAGAFGAPLIYIEGDKSRAKVARTTLRGDGVEYLTSTKEGPATQPAIGPNNQAAWVERRGKAWRLVEDGRLVSEGELHLSPAFLADGTLTASVSGQENTTVYAWVKNNRQALGTGHEIEISASFSADGGRMAYVVGREGQPPKIFVKNLATGAAGPVLPAENGPQTDPAWSPKGDLIAFVLNEKDICVVAPDGSGFKRLATAQGEDYYRRPYFSADGRLLVYAASFNNGPQEIWLMNAAGGRAARLLPAGVDKSLPVLGRPVAMP